MNRIMFYNKLDKYHLAHATDEWGKQYYNKLDNYYPSGKARYFYTKEEWDAYQREQQGKAQDNFKKQQEAKKLVSNSKPLSASDILKIKAEEAANNKLKETEELVKQYKQNENYTKNKEAAEARAKEEKERYSKLHEENNPSPKTREEAEREAIKKEQERIRKADIEAKKRPEIKALDQAKDELTKLKGKQNLAKNRGLDDKENKKEYDKLAKEIEAKEKEIASIRKKMADETLANRDKEIKEATERQQAYIKAEERRLKAEENAKAKKEAEEQGRKALKELNEKQEVINKYKTASNTELDQQYTATKNLIEQCNNSKDEIQFKLDNLLVDELKTEIASQDPEFISKWNGDLTNYLQPWNDGWYWFINGHDDSGHGKIANDALEKVVNKYKTAIDNTTYDDATNATGTYLEKKKEEYDRQIESDITQDIAKAKLSLIKVHQGDSKKFEINDSLKKILENKLEQIDEKYDGDLYDYIKPYFGLSFLPDNASYQNIEDILNEMEEELKSGKDPYGVYAEYYNNIKDAVYNA